MKPRKRQTFITVVAVVLVAVMVLGTVSSVFLAL